MTDRSKGPGRGPGKRPKPQGRTSRSSGDRPLRGGGAPRPKRSTGKSGADDRGEGRPERSTRPAFKKSPARPFRDDREELPKRSAGRPEREDRGQGHAERGARPAFKKGPARPYRDDRGDRPGRGAGRPDRDDRGEGRSERGARPAFGKGPALPRRDGDDMERGPGSGDRHTSRYTGEGKPFRTGRRPSKPRNTGSDDGLIRLNRYLAQSGVASRREADELIAAGVVTVNGQVVTELGTKVRPGDKVHYGGQRLSMEKKRYVLLNKPKGFITTTDDPRNRRTVMALVDDACTERIYPVGRLDRATTGVLLLTNDGDLAKKLMHPSHGAEKIYHVTLDKAVTKAHLEQLVTEVVLDDGPAQADEATHVEGSGRKEVGLKLHSGRNRVVRRMFEALGYEVVKLDRVVFAGLTKKDIPRGTWRHLTEKEVLFLTKRK